MTSKQYSPVLQELKQFDSYESTESRIDEPKWPRHQSHIPWTKKLSVYIALGMVASVVAIFAVIGFLCFLWATPLRDEGDYSWISIVSHGWMLKAVTISGLILRTATSTLATAATSMLACVILERRGVALPATALLSAVRVINNGPLSLFPILYRISTRTFSLACLTTALIMVTFMLQFSSTALVADFGDGVLAMPSKEYSSLVGVAMDNYNLTRERMFHEQPYWSNHIQTLATFAESHESPPPRSQNDPVRDTGRTFRAFVPFNDTMRRTSLKRYIGAATVLDSRVVCVRPKIHTGLSIGLTGDYGWVLNGSLTPEVIPAGLILPDFTSYTQDTFSTTFKMAVNQSRSKTQVLSHCQQVPYSHNTGDVNAIQKIMYQGSALVSSLDPRYSDIVARNCSDCGLSNPENTVFTLQYFKGRDDIPLLTGRSYVLVSGFTNDSLIDELLNTTITNGANGTFFSQDQDANRLELTPHNEWLRFYAPRAGSTFDVSVTLCYDSFVAINAHVNISSDLVLSEPTLTTWNATANSFDLSAMLHQLAANETAWKNTTERGIMTLHTTPDQLQDQVRTWYEKAVSSNQTDFAFPNQNFIALDMFSRKFSGTIFCMECALKFMPKVLVDHVMPGLLQKQVFQSAIQRTFDTARTMQAYHTVLGRMSYYSTLSLFDIPDSASISWFETIQFPQSWDGLSAVLVVLGVQLILVTLITVIFFQKTRFGYVGDNAWQSLAQAHSEQLSDTIQRTTMMHDDDVDKYLKSVGLSKEIMILDSLKTGVDGPRVGLKKIS